jgi:hypothetical protein
LRRQPGVLIDDLLWWTAPGAAHGSHGSAGARQANILLSLVRKSHFPNQSARTITHLLWPVVPLAPPDCYGDLLRNAVFFISWATGDKKRLSSSVADAVRADALEWLQKFFAAAIAI